MPITDLPDPPSRSDAPATFISRADAFVAALPQFVAEANALAQAGDFNAIAWVSGTTYAIGDRRYSPIDFATYRRKTSGAGTTDPSADATNWAPLVVYPTTTAPRLLENIGLTVTMAANAVTVALKGANGSDPSSSNKVGIGFRSATLTSGAASKVEVAAANSVAISSGSTLGTTSGLPSRVWVAAILVSGAVELAVYNDGGTGKAPSINEDGLISTTAEGGAGAADSARTWYSTTARSNVPFVLLGYFDSTQATAGTWASAASLVAVAPQIALGPTGPAASSLAGTATDWTGVPAGTKLIVIPYEAASLDGSGGVPILQLGDAGGFETSGYAGTAGDYVPTANHQAMSSGFTFGGGAGIGAAAVIHGVIALALTDPATNTWTMSHFGARSDSASTNGSSGSKSVSEPLTQLRFTTVAGTASWDAGKARPMYFGGG